MSAIHDIMVMVNAHFESGRHRRFMANLRQQQEDIARIWDVQEAVARTMVVQPARPRAPLTACRSCGAGEVMEHRGQRLCAYCRMPR